MSELEQVSKLIGVDCFLVTQIARQSNHLPVEHANPCKIERRHRAVIDNKHRYRCSIG